MAKRNRTTMAAPRVACVLGLLAAFSLIAPPTASAYVDPTSGSVMLQVAAAGLLAGAYTLKRCWAQTKQALRGFWLRLTGR